MTEAEATHVNIPENQKELPRPVMHTIVEFPYTINVDSNNTEKKKLIGRRYRQIGITCLQLKEDGTTPLYTHYADPELIKSVYSDELTDLLPQESIEKIEHLKNAARQATYRLGERLKRFAAEQNSNDQNAKNFLDELRAISPLYKNLDVYQLLALIDRGSKYDFYKILENPEEKKGTFERRNKNKHIGDRQRGLVLGLLERDDEDGYVYDYYGDKKLIKDVWADKINKNSTKRQSQRKIVILTAMANESVTNFITRLRKGDANVLNFLDDYRENNPYYENVGNEELIIILTRKRTLPVETKRVNPKKRMNVKTVKEKTSEIRIKSTKKRPNKRKSSPHATKKEASKKVAITIIRTPKPEPTSKPKPNISIRRDPKTTLLNHLIDIRDGVEEY